MTSSNEPPLLTAEGRRRLEERLRRLREETIPTLAAALEETDDDLSLQLEYDMANNEIERLEYVLETARSTDEIPADPDVVQIGDWVEISTGEGTSRHLIVHPAEAGVDEGRISSDSPLAKAILGRRVGEEVAVEAPAGVYTARIIEVLRAG